MSVDEFEKAVNECISKLDKHQDSEELTKIYLELIELSNRLANIKGSLYRRNPYTMLYATLIIHSMDDRPITYF